VVPWVKDKIPHSRRRNARLMSVFALVSLSALVSASVMVSLSLLASFVYILSWKSFSVCVGIIVHILCSEHYLHTTVHKTYQMFPIRYPLNPTPYRPTSHIPYLTVFEMCDIERLMLKIIKLLWIFFPKNYRQQNIPRPIHLVKVSGRLRSVEH